MGTLLVLFGLIFTFGGLYLVGHEAFLMGSLQTIASSVASATANSITAWFAVNVSPNAGNLARAALDLPRAPVLVAFGVIFLTIGLRMSKSRRTMN